MPITSVCAVNILLITTKYDPMPSTFPIEQKVEAPGTSPYFEVIYHMKAGLVKSCLIISC